ncbi:type II secretion system F family protein [Sporohalobacter salinus]|uniref:type II secretion system F family protein n=1 Tax=Sporohalobacter salinus TaxID=1494606 RepID=UPI001962003D|nr:type II secretion system F family protein [Sporohalobacter salinus]MBM7623782.1 type II secretion system protein F [Sporohalobacter salinus]
MAQFDYQALDNQGQTVNGVIEGRNLREAKNKLQSRDLHVFEIDKQESQEEDNNSFSGQLNLFNNDNLISFTKQLANLLGAGIQLGEALQIISNLMSGTEFSKVVTDIYKSIKGGQSFAEALQEHPQHFSASYCGMIKAGEEGGFLDLTCQRLSQNLESSKKLKSFIITSLIYPFVLVVVTILAVIIMLTYVLPKFVSIYENYGNNLPYLTKILLDISQFISHYGLLILLGIGIIVIGSYFYYQTNAGKKKVDNWILELPVIGELISIVSIAKIARNLGTMLESGVPLLKGLKFSQHVTNNIIIKEALQKSATRVKKGGNLADALEKNNIFPAVAVQMMGVGERTGKLSEMLLQLADNFEENYKETLEKLMKIFEPVIILVMGLIIGVIVVAMLMPILGMNTISL